MLLVRTGRKRHHKQVVHASRIPVAPLAGLSNEAKQYLKTMGITNLERLAKMKEETVKLFPQDKGMYQEISEVWRNIQSKINDVHPLPKRRKCEKELSKDDRLTLRALDWFQSLFAKKDFTLTVRAVVPRAFLHISKGEQKKETIGRRLVYVYKMKMVS